MHSPWSSDIGRNSLVMSGTGIPVRSPFPIGFGPEEKKSPKAENRDGDEEIFLIRGGSGKPFLAAIFNRGGEGIQRKGGPTSLALFMDSFAWSVGVVVLSSFIYLQGVMRELLETTLHSLGLCCTQYEMKFKSPSQSFLRMAIGLVRGG
jgi:hypothetical protein